MDLHKQTIPAGGVKAGKLGEDVHSLIAHRGMNLAYGPSRIDSGLALGLTGAANTFTLSSGTGLVDGRYVHWRPETSPATAASVRAVSLITESGYSVKDPYIVKEGSTWYLFYTRFANTDPFATAADIHYATSSDLVTWTPQGEAVDHTDCWGVDSGPAYAPSIIKIGATWYMFVCGHGTGYLTASALAGTWTWVDYAKSGGTALTIGDPHIVLVDGTYYMVGSLAGTLYLYSCTDFAANNWTSVGPLLDDTTLWDAGDKEAPFLLPGTPNILFYGGTDADEANPRQRIGMAVSQDIAGPYRRVGSGMVLLDRTKPENGGVLHPFVFFDSTSNYWYLFCCMASDSTENRANEIAGYRSTDMLRWEPLATSATLIASATNYVYFNPAGMLMHAGYYPFNYHAAATPYVSDSMGLLPLGTLTVDGGSIATAAAAHTFTSGMSLRGALAYGQIALSQETGTAQTGAITLGAFGVHEQRVNRNAGSLSSGEIVAYAANADGISVDYTTTAGDPKVCGVVSETITAGSTGRVRTSGTLTNLKVDGTSLNIAIGDLLGCSSTPGVAKKAEAGETACAIAKAAATSATTIAARVITPRKV